jgi:hypothetical protein
MLIFYADESGDGSMALEAGAAEPRLTSGTSPRFTLAAVGIRDTSRRPLAEALLALKRRHFGPAAQWADTEIKGRYLFAAAQRRKAGNKLVPPVGYEAMTTPARVAALTRDLGLLITKFRPHIFCAVVDKVAMLASERTLPPIGVAYTLLHQRIAVALEDLYSGESGVIVADQQSQHETLFRAGELHETRRVLSEGLHREPDYNLVLDKPLWVDTELSVWDREIIQLADIAAYTATEFVARRRPPHEPWFLWEYLRPHFATNFGTGRIVGGGVAIYPKTAPRPVE